jgi:ribosomal protein S18 acetylase RimI-like enzyme
VSLTVLTSAAEVLLATDHDPWVRGALHRPHVSGWAGHGAVAWRATDPEERVPYVSFHGSPASAAKLLEELLTELPHGTRVTLPRGTPALLPAWVALDGTDWDFFWYDAPPTPRPAEERVVELDAAEVAPVLTTWSPTASALPGDEAVRRWVGVRGPDGLLACAADTSTASGVGHLSSIAVSPDARGQGLGTAVTASLSRRLFAEGCDMVTLGMYAHNEAGRALYRGLGMKDDHLFTSGPLQVRSRW